MGIVISAERFSPGNQEGLFKPIMYCCHYKEIFQHAISINKLLAEKLYELDPNRRTLQLEKCFSEVIKNSPDNCIIQDFDVMFNPTYKVDVLKIMVNVCKTKPFSILWPGRLENNKLIYAETGYPDYKAFDIKDYDVTCVK